MELLTQTPSGPSPAGRTFRAPRTILVVATVLCSAFLALLLLGWTALLDAGFDFPELALGGLLLTYFSLRAVSAFLSATGTLLLSFSPTEWILSLQDERMLITMPSIEPRPVEPLCEDGGSSCGESPQPEAPSLHGAYAPKGSQVLALDYAEVEAAHRTSVSMWPLGRDPETTSPRIVDFVDIRVNRTEAVELEGLLTPEGAIRIPWIGYAVIEALKAAGVEITEDLEVTQEPSKNDLEPLRMALQQLIHDGRGKEAFALMKESPLLNSLPAGEMKKFIGNLNY